MRWVMMAAALAAAGCSGGEALSARVEGYCGQLTARVASWAADPSRWAASRDGGALMREGTFCLRVRAGDQTDAAVQALSTHVDALAGASTEPGPHLEAIEALLVEAAGRPLVR